MHQSHIQSSSMIQANETLFLSPLAIKLLFPKQDSGTAAAAPPQVISNAACVVSNKDNGKSELDGIPFVITKRTIKSTCEERQQRQSSESKTSQPGSTSILNIIFFSIVLCLLGLMVIRYFVK